MTPREELLNVLRGGKADRVPFTCYTGLMPPGADEIPNLLPVHTAALYHTETPGVSLAFTDVAPGVRETTMTTPWGTLTQLAHTETGYGSSWTKEHWIKGPDDYGVIEQLIRHTTLTPHPEAYAAAREAAGDRGVVIAWTTRTPFQRLWIEYAGMERMALDTIDAPEAVAGVLDAMFDQSERIMRMAAASEARVIWIPDNITGDMTGPPAFRKYLQPYYEMVCDILLPAGKLPVTHMDGMLRQIADEVARTGLPVIEAFTPPPDGNLSVVEARERWPGKALWLNFPSSVHLSPPEEIKRATEELVRQAGDGAGFVIGVTENIPASVGARSLQAIGEVLR